MTQVLPPNRAREYETIAILNPDAIQEQIDKVTDRAQDVMKKMDGKLLRAENWGRRKLAYPVRKHSKGMYIYMRYLGYQGLVHELERHFRALDAVMKFMTVKLDEDVDPEARPVSEGDISFVAAFDEPGDASHGARNADTSSDEQGTPADTGTDETSQAEGTEPSTPETSPEATPETSPEATPETTPEATPEAPLPTADSDAETVVEETPAADTVENTDALAQEVARDEDKDKE